MNRARVVRDYRTQYANPIRFAAGEIVTLGARDTEWPAFIWTITADGNAGWAPFDWLRPLGDGRAEALRKYSAQELEVSEGEEVTAHFQVGGWWWCGDKRRKRGWIPGNALEIEEMKPANHERLETEEIKICLERSGYLLESRIVRTLEENDYFVEPNQVLRDQQTGKSREIDFIAEHYGQSYDKSIVKTSFVGEVINNRFPLVLVTNRPATPNSPFEDYVKFAYNPNYEMVFKFFSAYEERKPPDERLFSQWCVISRKNSNEAFMASHPDDTYHSFRKISEHIESCISEYWHFEETNDEAFWRVLFWHPMLVLGGDLFAAKSLDDGSVEISEIDSAFLEFNWHLGEEKKTTVIEVIRFNSLLDRMNSIVASDQKMQEKLAETRKHFENQGATP